MVEEVEHPVQVAVDVVGADQSEMACSEERRNHQESPQYVVEVACVQKQGPNRETEDVVICAPLSSGRVV